jgi:flagellar biogenesis protein FliO
VVLLAQADGLALSPDTPEMVWGVISTLLLVAFVMLLVWLVRTVSRGRHTARSVQSLEDRVARLEDERSTTGNT